MTPRLTNHPFPGSGVVAFSTTREGGVSQGRYASFNINAYCGDDPEAVRQNRRLLSAELGVTEEALVVPHQVHGVEARVIDDRFLSLSAAARLQLVEGVDAVMTRVPGICVGVSTADCIPVLLYAPDCQAVCAVHAGWRGTVARVVQRAVAVMQEAFCCDPSQLQAVVGPGISQAAFEVGDEVYARFLEAGFPMEQMARRYVEGTMELPSATRPGPLRWHLDLPRCNQWQLEELGVPASHIRLTGLCTYTQADRYFSARRLGTASGRVYNGIMLRRQTEAG